MTNESQTLHRQEFVNRAIQLHTMGFTREESHAIAQSEIGHALTTAEWAGIWKDVRASLKNQIAEDSYDVDFNTAINRIDYVQGQLLIMFQNALANHTAMLEGKSEHDPDPDGFIKPVIPVKALDVAALGEKIIKLDQDRLTMKLRYPAAVANARQALGANPALPSTKESLAARTRTYVDEYDEDGIVDADFEETK